MTIGIAPHGDDVIWSPTPENIANANTVHGVDGKPYQRQVVVFESALNQAMNNDGTSMVRPENVCNSAMLLGSVPRRTR